MNQNLFISMSSFSPSSGRKLLNDLSVFVSVLSADPPSYSLLSKDLGESEASGSLGGYGTGWSPLIRGGGSGIT